MPRFKYSALDLSRDSFRLLRVGKGSLCDDISCSLIKSTLEAAKEIAYKALSYTWGGFTHTPSMQKSVRCILVNDQEFEVTENLFSALRYIRNLNEDLVLWVDAICVDQANEIEKGHQVRQMGGIFKAANEVIIWLGPSNDDIKELMESMAWIDRKAAEAQGFGSCENWKRLCHYFMAERLGSLPFQPYSRIHQALSMLLERRWFKRVWILQEVAMAKMAWIVCGSYSCPARTFALMPSLIGLKVDQHTQSVLDIMPRLRKDTWWSTKRNLHQLLVKFSRSDATDERDKVYALLGISEDALDSKRFGLCYKKAKDQVFRDTACFLLCGRVLDSTYSFPKFTFQELCLPLTQLVQKTLSWTSTQIGEQRESAQKTATLIIGRLREGQLNTSDIMLSPAERYGQAGAVQTLLSCASLEVNIKVEIKSSILRLISKEGIAQPLGPMSPPDELEERKQSIQTPAKSIFPFKEDDNMTDIINGLIETNASKQLLLMAYSYAGDLEGVQRMIAEGADVNGGNENSQSLYFALEKVRARKHLR